MLPRIPTVLALLAVIVFGAAAPAGLTGAPASLGGREAFQTRAPVTGPVVHIPVSGTIELGLAPFIERSLRDAREAGASAVILEIETPGGRIDAAQRIVKAIGEAEIPVYAFINRNAFSAGAMIALATDGIFMVPGAVIGAATPVGGDGEKASEKIVSAMRAEMRALADRHGLDPRIAEAMVDEEIEIPDLVEKGKLLTLTTGEAVAIGYAKEIAGWGALMEALGLAEADVVPAEINWAELTVRFLTHPIVAPLLLSLGFLGLIIEFKTPGFGLGGIVGAAALVLFFGSHFIIGLAGWEALILLGIGILLLGIEIFVVPGFGFFGIGGIIGVLAGIYLSMLGRLATSLDYARAATMLSITIIVVLVCAWVLLRRLPQSRRFARTGILLGEEMTRERGYLSGDVREDLVGTIGQALTDLRPAGTGQFGDERIDVTADGNWIAAGSRIRVIRSEGYRHVVREAE
jgi:membrane-bound serine protease (ClpP class)